MSVRTRFAPSPTGYMHIGGMRTALFNWLWARHNNGKFILRIDDTDQQRNIAEAIQPILNSFRWLGLDWDEGPEIGGPHEPYFQSQRGDRYQAELKRLLLEGKAYRDFDPPERVKQDREAAEREKRNYLNIRRSLDLSLQEIDQRTAAGDPHVVRFLIDRDRKVSIDDAIRGHVEWDCALISDPVISRQNGSPLYNFATVVDDIDLAVSHVIRAEEHLTNSAVQLLLFEALGATPPQFAHIPFVAAPSTTKKLSKRDLKKYQTNPQFKRLFETADVILPPLGLAVSDELNPVMVSFYETLGFLPEAVLNALARLGWSLDDSTEIMSLDFIVENFTLGRVVKGAAGFDPDKLLAFQEHWMGQLSTDAKVDRCLPYLAQAGWVDNPDDTDNRAFVARLIEALGDRLKLFGDILRYDEYFVADANLAYDEKAFEKRLRKPEDAADLLRQFRDELASVDDFSPGALEQRLHHWVEQQGIKIGRIIHALRVGTTGKAVGPGMFECLALLGKDRCLARIDQSLERI